MQVLSVCEDGGQQVGEAVPCDLDANAEEDEGYNAQDAVGGGGTDYLSDFWGITVAEIDVQAGNQGED